MKIETTEHYDRHETTTRRVEFRIAPRLSTIQAAVNAAIGELTQLGFDPNDAGVNVHYRFEGGVGVISYEVEVDDPVTDQLPTDERGFAGILAALPRDWPRALRTALQQVGVTTEQIDDLLTLVDRWVLGATRENERT